MMSVGFSSYVNHIKHQPSYVGRWAHQAPLSWCAAYFNYLSWITNTQSYNDPEGEGFKIKSAEDLNLCLEEETRLSAQAERIKEQGASLMHSFQSTPCFQPLPIFISTWTVEEIITHAITHLEYLRDG